MATTAQKKEPRNMTQKHTIEIDGGCPDKIPTVKKFDTVEFVNVDNEARIVSKLGPFSQTIKVELAAKNKAGASATITIKNGAAVKKHTYQIWRLTGDGTISEACGGASNPPEMIVGG